MTQQALVDLAAKLETLDRGPFRQMLAALLGVRPTRSSLQKFANRSPDRWAQALSVLGALSGYERGALFQVNLFDVKRLSDAELLAEAQRHGVTIDVAPLAKTVEPPGPQDHTGGGEIPAGDPPPPAAELPRILSVKGE